MKKDIFEEHKPEVFKYEDDIAPSMYFFAILSIIIMVGLGILFAFFLWALISTVPSLK